MRIDSEYILSTDPVEQKSQIEKALKRLSYAVDGTIREFEPLLYGSTTAGDVKYTTQEGWYIRQAQIVDYWFTVGWSNWTSGAGYIRMGLPLKTWMSDNDIWVGSVISDNVDFENADDTYLSCVGLADSYDCEFVGSPNALVVVNKYKSPIFVQTAGSLIGHIRYLGQPEL